jgi:hypothetical protein
MVGKPSGKTDAWSLFDHIVSEAAPGGVHSNPWVAGTDGQISFEPDYAVLEQLLGVPLHLRSETQSGVPALALDVWLSYEFRRAGFDPDQVWPRPSHPRVVPAAAAALIKSLPAKLREQVQQRVSSQASIPNVTSSSAKILGKNYLKQVDVIMTDWVTGPELLISTKRMDSSYGKNAPNRVEESYGDAKNLRLRHPLAALGFVFGLRSDILTKEAKIADWLFDLLAKLGQEDDAYHATCLILMDYDAAPLPGPDVEPPEPGIPEPGAQVEEDGVVSADLPDTAAAEAIKRLPRVTILRDRTPAILAPGRFLAAMVTRVLAATPVNMHEEARRRRSAVAAIF